MDQLVLVGVIVLFTILDGIARKKKKEAQGQLQGQEPYIPTPEEADWKWEPVGEDLPSYDQDPSFDDHVEDDVRPTSPSPSGAEGLIPKDVWAEIAALASGNPPPRPEPAPPVPVVPLPEKRPERGPARPEHRAHLAHAKYGQPVSGRLRPMDTPEMHEVRGFSPEILSVRALLGGGEASLRQAIILQEILGTPVSLRED